MTTSRNLCYDVSPYQRHLWRYRKMVDANAEASEREGRKQYEAFPDFTGEVFHRLYSDKEQPLEVPAPGSELFQKMHDEMQKIPELQDLRDRCRGDEEYSGIGTSAIVDTLLRSVDGPEEQMQDLRDDAEEMEYLQRLLQKTDDPEQQEAIRESMQEVQDGIDQKQTQANQTAAMCDESQVRRAVRTACQQANEEIDEVEKMVDSFSAGQGQHSGRKARKQISQKLAPVIKNNDRMKRIIELAGRLRRIAIQQQSAKPRKGTDEVTGIEMGDNLAKLVPVEALYTDDEVEMVFAAKLAERSLLQFELNKTPPKQQGPIVVLLDSSGSMRANDADAWAAAVSLAFLEIARRAKPKRAFAIVHFGYDVLRIDEWTSTEEVSLESLIEAVSFFAADAGTNFMAPIDAGIARIRKHGEFKEADLIMVTDGCANVSDDWLRKFGYAKEDLDFNLYSILVGNQTRKDTNELFSDDVVLLNEVLRDDSAMHKFFKEV
jgi:uncharacterized protein with von Willebrand factor type A (vWA) domain